MKNVRYAPTLLMVVLSAVVIFSSRPDSIFLKKMLKPVIVQSCNNELKQSKFWQTAAFFMSTARQAGLEKEICKCVSEHALDHVATQDLLRASIDKSAKEHLIQQAVLSSIKGCAARVLE